MVTAQPDIKEQVKQFKERQKEETRDKRIDIAMMLGDKLKDAARNPEKFKMTHVLLMDNGSVCYEYRAQNGFGGMNIGSAVLSSKSAAIKTDEMEGFHKQWNKECSGKTGEDITHFFRFPKQ